jgi:hypothetical protein
MRCATGYGKPWASLICSGAKAQFLTRSKNEAHAVEWLYSPPRGAAIGATLQLPHNKGPRCSLTLRR